MKTSSALRLVLAMLSTSLLLAACDPASQQADHAAVPEDFPPRAGTSATEPPPPTRTTTRWRCEELLVATTHHGDTVDLFFSGRTLALPLAMSASGARHADTRGNEFWSKGDSAMLTLAGTPKRDCTTTEDVSPWDAARTRGVVFRAVGSEPGWLVELSGGAQPSLDATLDNGQRRVSVADAQGDATSGFNGKAEDGSEVKLQILDQACTDAMSGEQFPASAELTVGSETFRGCGAHLSRQAREPLNNSTVIPSA